MSEAYPARSFNLDADLPEELTVADQWVCWIYKHGAKKPGKEPVDPRTLKNLSWGDPSTWLSFDQAVEAYRNNPQINGIGIILTAELGLIGGDLDHAIDLATGEVHEWAQTHVGDFDTYTEITPGADGFRLFVCGELPQDSPRKVGNREIYDAGRFLTITGNAWNDRPIAADRAAAVGRYIGAMCTERKDRTGGESTAVGGSNEDELAALFAGVNLHDTTRDLPFRLLDDGMKPGKVVEFIRAAMKAMPDKGDTSRWQERYNDIPRSVRTAAEVLARCEAEKTPPNVGERELDLMAVRNEPPARREVIRNLLPLGHPTLLAADGGVGKTLLTQQLATAVVAGIDWLGEVCEPGPVLAYYCEDPIDELWRRQRGICRQFGIDPAALKDHLHIRSRIGLDNALMSFDARDKHAIEHPLLSHVENEVARIRPRLLILDNLAQMFMGDLSDTPMVTQFANRMARIALREQCAIVMTAHTPKSGAEYYGAVAWNNAVRSRFFMESETETDPNNPARMKPTGRVFFSRPKANYGQRTGAVILRWHDDALVRDDQPQTVAEHAVVGERMRLVDDTLLGGLVTLTERKVNASHNSRAANYLPKLLEAHQIANGISRKELSRGLSRLVMNGRVAVDVGLWQRGNRSWVSGLQAAEGIAA